jgi:hypothetical protein
MFRIGNTVSICLILLLVGLFGCSSDDTDISVKTASSAVETFVPAKGPVSANGFQGILITNDLAIGHNRIAFFVINKDGFVDKPITRVKSYYVDRLTKEKLEKDVRIAIFKPWLYGRGSYVTTLEFDQAGLWELEIEILNPADESQTVVLPFAVNTGFQAPGVGSMPKPINNKTLAQVSSIEELTSGSVQFPRLYQISVSEALMTKTPIVISIYSPAFCQSIICGPQVEVLNGLENKYKDMFHFIHIDVYSNPHEMRSDLGKSILSSVVVDWQLPSVPWTFIIDGNGVVMARFEGFALISEVEEALQELLA